MPRWIEIRGLLRTGRAEVHPVADSAAIVVGKASPWAFAVGDPSSGVAAFVRAFPDVRVLLVQRDDQSAVESVLPWRPTPAVLHLHAEPETMLRLLERLRERYGGVREYARAVGVADADVDQLRARLLEE